MISNLQDAYNKLAKTKWSFVNNFRVHFSFQKSKGQNSIFNDLPNDLTETLNSIENGDEEIYLQDCNIPALTYSPIQTWINHQWFLGTSVVEKFDINVKFIDHDQLKLYRFFSYLLLKQRDSYTDDVKFTMRITKLSDYSNESDKDIVVLDDCLISNISQIDFKNSTADGGSIAEVVVGIISPKITLCDGNLTNY